MPVNIAVAGNPNCGKTTLFNLLTGSSLHIGNWAGVTVEKKTGRIKGTDFRLTDLPGIYSMSPDSDDEKISVEFLLNNRPDAVINVIDGTNIERNLFLTLSIAELKIPMLVLVNMIDEVNASGGFIDCELLSSLTGITFIPISARSGENTDKIPNALKELISKKSPDKIRYENSVQNALNSIYSVIRTSGKELPYTFFASEVLSENQEITKRLGLTPEQSKKIEEIRSELRRQLPGKNTKSAAADAKYKYIEWLSEKAVSKNTPPAIGRIDKIVMGKFLAFPIFLLIMLTVFVLTFGPPGRILSRLADDLISGIIPLTENLLNSLNAPSWTIRLVCSGIISGVGGVVQFLPQIAIFFLCLSVLEDSGYMARAAFITDSFMKKIGLSGKAFIPLIMGFGCTTTAAMASRTQENTSERKMTIMLTPFMSCGAKLPVYALFTGIFFPRYGYAIIFCLYAAGLLMAVLCGILFGKTIFKNRRTSFIMELPPYRMPHFSSVIKNTWEKTKDFLLKAGSVIFSLSIVIWLLQNILSGVEESVFSDLVKYAAPVFKPLGFGSSEAVVSLLSGIVAKEAIVSSFEILSPNGISETLMQNFTPVSALSFLIFVLLYTPCISAISSIKKETGSLGLAIFSAFFQFFIAYVSSLLFYQTAGFILNHKLNPSLIVSLLCSALIIFSIYTIIKNLHMQLNGKCGGSCNGCEKKCSRNNQF